jgi:hypothetical protein
MTQAAHLISLCEGWNFYCSLLNADKNNFEYNSNPISYDETINSFVLKILLQISDLFSKDSKNYSRSLVLKSCCMRAAVRN